MYKKFLSITLLVSMAHALLANELEVSAVNTIESSEPLASTNIESQEQVTEVQEVAEIIPAIEVKEENSEVAEAVEVQEQITEVQEAAEIVPAVEAKEENTEVVAAVEAQEQEVEEVTAEIAVAPIVNEVAFGFSVTSNAGEMLNGLSDEARADFNDFSIEIGKDLLELPEIQAFVTKHEAICAEYKAYKNESLKISVDFFILGEESINAIKSKIDETNAQFKATLSEESKLKFEEARQDLSNVLETALEVTLFKISARKFTHELINLDKNQELMVNVRID